MKHQAKPKTFCDSFDEQMDIAEALYGMQIRFQFGYNEVKAILDQAEIYTTEIRKRVLDLVMSQRFKYQYLFI